MAIGYGLMLALVMFLLALALLKLHALDVKEQYAGSIIAGRAEEAVNIQVSFLTESIALHSYLATREPAYHQSFHDSQRSCQQALKRLGAFPMTPKNLLLYTQITRLAADYDRMADLAVVDVERGLTSTDLEKLENQLRTVRTTLSDAAWQFTILQRQERVSANQDMDAIRSSLLSTLYILALIVLMVSVLVAWLTIQAVRRPAQRLINAIRSMETSDYHAALSFAREYPQGDRRLRNELHIVAGALGRMAERIQNREAELAVKNRQLKRQNERLHRALERLRTNTQALRLKGAALAEADRRKDEFLAMLAHELRNPLAAISNANYVLERGESSPAKLLQMRDMISRQLRHLSRLIDDLLDVSRITRGKVTLRREKVDLARVVQECVDACQEASTRAGLSLCVTLPGEELALQADPLRLEQMVANLLSNSIKYTEAGGNIYVDVQREHDWAVMRIRDTGIGIAPQLLPSIFELFAQADSGIDRAKGGLGIGLTLVRSLAEMHGGMVEAQSAGLGQGSEFILRLPLINVEVIGDEADGSTHAAHG